MSKELRLPGGLTAKERIFAELMCKGLRPRDAYRQAGYAKRATDKQANSAALTKAKQPAIVNHMADWLARARISDLDNPSAAVSRTLRYLNQAEDAGNQTALAALQRLAYQHNGIAERTQISVEHVISDQDLLRRIAGDDEQKMHLLTSLLRPGTFAKQPEPILIEGHAEPDSDEQT